MKKLKSLINIKNLFFAFCLFASGTMIYNQVNKLTKSSTNVNLNNSMNVEISMEENDKVSNDNERVKNENKALDNEEIATYSSDYSSFQDMIFNISAIENTSQFLNEIYANASSQSIKNEEGPFWFLRGMTTLGISNLIEDTFNAVEKDDVNINDSNEDGSIIVYIDETRIHILNSYQFTESQMSDILDYIMESDYYKDLGYSRSKDSYLKEWKAHNFIHSLVPYGDVGERTANVDLNINETEDEFSWAYLFF